ncbi:MAG: cold shock domain-containing protein [Pseudomonadales bacterium]
MQVPIEISFGNTHANEAIRSLIDDETAKLERICDHVSSCRIALDEQPEPKRARNPYRVRVEVHVPPRHTLVAESKPRDSDVHDPLPMVIRGTFKAMQAQLRKLVEKQHGHVKAHPVEQENLALVSRLFPEAGYGFIKTPDGRDIYFHRNAVLHHDFDRLTVGTAVRFVEEQGNEGPQASTVQVIDKPGARISDDAQVPPPYGWEQK